MRTEYDDVIRAWLDGAEVEEMHPVYTEGQWQPLGGLLVVDDINWQLRIASPAQEPKYLYVYNEVISDIDGVKTYSGPRLTSNKIDNWARSIYLGKIRLEE
jgi:hypothetical protein